MKMKNFIAFILLVLAFACHANAEEIVIVGTGDGVIILKAIGDAFTQNNPEVKISIPESIGSGGGIKAVGTDKNLIGRAAREIQEKEKPYGLTWLPFAKVPTVFFVNPGTGIQNLSAQQVCDIYSGKTANWKEVGGKDAKIKLVRREDGDSSLNALIESLPGFKAITISPNSKTTFSTPENFSSVESIPDTIGFGPYDVAKSAKVETLKIDGKSPTDAGYPCLTTLAFIYKEANKTGSLKKFLEFAVSPAALESIKRTGGIPFSK